MSNKVTTDILRARLKCRYKAHLKMQGEQGEVHDYELLLKEDRELVCATARAKLLARYPSEQVASGLPLTADLLKRGLPLLLDTTFEDGDVSVCFDALLWVVGASPLGEGSYVPVLFDQAEKPTPDLRMLIGIHAELLAGVQGKEPATGLLFHGRGCQLRKIKLAGIVPNARKLLRKIREARTGEPPRLLLSDHCQMCEFRKRCQAEALAKDDLSLLRGMGEAEVTKYTKRGIFTVAQLSCTFRPPRRTKNPKDRKVMHSHALQALAIREKKIHVLGNPVLPLSTKRLYFDLEGDPERGFCYLAGIIVREGENEQRHSFWIDSPADEPRLLDQILALAAQNQDAWLYTYGSYEATYLRRAGKAAGREEEIGRVLARSCNVLSLVYNHVSFPVHSNGLKNIAGFLGFAWHEPDASGLLSVVWRRRWEQTCSPTLKDKLLIYNLEDCDALRRITDFLYAIHPGGPPHANTPSLDHVEQVARVQEMVVSSARPEWRQSFSDPDFAFINERAYFDYQRDKVFIRTSKLLKKDKLRKRKMKGKKDLKVNRNVEISSQVCNSCGGTELTQHPDGRLFRFALDLRIGRSGIRRWVTRFTTTWHSCTGCGGRFLPTDFQLLQEHFHSLKSWAMYEYVAHRKSQANIAETLQDCFGLPISTSQISNFKQLLGSYYKGTYQRLLEKIIAGELIHADETEITVKRVGKGYVWVLTNMEEVVYIYRKSREGDFLHELLKGFQGVLVSDFYAAYDSLPCEQQKCLIHLIRDINTDVKAHPWDEELKALASSFGVLLRSIVSTVDKHGLKAKNLGTHRGDVDRFFESHKENELRSEVAEGLRKRLLKCQDTLFTFLGHDGIPWNNNNAEHAVKRFAQYREITDGQVTEDGLNDYLVLLSVFQSCKYKNVSFLKFLLSQETDIDVFRQNGAKKRPVSAVEIHPEGRPWLSSKKRVRGQPSSGASVTREANAIQRSGTQSSGER